MLTGLLGGAFFWSFALLLADLWSAPLALLLTLLTMSIAARRPGFRTVVLWSCVGMVFALILVPGFLAARHQGRITQCRGEIVAMRTALERIYAHDGVYPLSLPSPALCPQAGQDTYTLGYVRSRNGLRYTLACAGTHHVRRLLGAPNRPAWSSGGFWLDP